MCFSGDGLILCSDSSPHATSASNVCDRGRLGPLNSAHKYMHIKMCIVLHLNLQGDDSSSRSSTAEAKTSGKNSLTEWLIMIFLKKE